MNEFGKKIKQLRGKKSIREAARNIGISHTYLDSLEKGVDPRTGKERKPTIDVINKISNYYDYDFFELASLADVFVSLRDTPKDLQEKEMANLAKRIRSQVKNDESDVKENYLELLSENIPFDVTLLLKNVYRFINNESHNKYIKNKKGENTNTIIFMATLIQYMAREKIHMIKQYMTI